MKIQLTLFLQHWSVDRECPACKQSLQCWCVEHANTPHSVNNTWGVDSQYPACKHSFYSFCSVDTEHPAREQRANMSVSHLSAKKDVKYYIFCNNNMTSV